MCAGDEWQLGATRDVVMLADCSGSAASSSNNTLTMSTAQWMRRTGSGGLIGSGSGGAAGGYHTDCSDDELESSSVRLHIGVYHQIYVYMFEST